MPETTGLCASDLLEVVPLIFRTIRAEMRQRRGADLSIPQFRSLIFLSRQPRAALNELAEYLGLTAPTTCKLVDDMAARELLTRAPSTLDRRKIELEITPRGVQLLAAARQGTLEQLSSLLEPLSAEEKTHISRSLALLRQIFAHESQK